MKKTRGLLPASSAVEGFFQSQELAQALRPHMAKARWTEIVGPQVAGVTQVEAVRDGILVVRVKNSVWANELTLLKDDMLRRLNLALGGRVLTDIHFKASGLARAKKAPAKLPEEAPTASELARIILTPDARARIDAATGRIADEALRERVCRAMTRAACAEEWKRRHGWLPCARCGSLAAPCGDLEADTPPVCSLCRPRAEIQHFYAS